MEARMYFGKNQGKQSKGERLQRIIMQRAQVQRMTQQMRLAEIQIAEKERRLISVTDMDELLMQIAAAVSTRIRSQPSRLMDRLKPHIKPESQDELFQLLTEESNSLLLELKTMEQGAGQVETADPETDDAFDELLADPEGEA